MHPLHHPRFAKYVVVVPSGCWIWCGGGAGNGYGKFNVLGRAVFSHRHSYEMVKGPIPAGLTIDHLCRVSSCVNPDHMEAVTHRVNCLRGVSPAAINALKTHCVHGHSLSDAYSYGLNGERRCRICTRARMRRRITRTVNGRQVVVGMKPKDWI